MGMASPRRSPGQPFPVPLFVGGTNRLLHCLGRAELLGEAARQSRVLGDHVAHVAIARDGEFDADTEAMQRWVPAAQQPHHCEGPAQAPLVVFVGLEPMSSPNHFACSWASE